MDGVNTHHKDFDSYAPKWQRCRDASDGQDAVHAASQKYLPRLKDQDDDDYLAYRKRANFFNATWRTIDGLRGMMFRKPPTLEFPAAIEGYLADIDLAGTSLETLAKTVALEVLEVGRVGLLVDHPTVTNVEGITQAVADAQGLRPSIQTYCAETILNWKYRRVNNRWVLSLVVLKETVDEPDGEFKVKCVDQWRVLDLDERDLYRVRLFQKATAGNAGGGEFVQIGDDLYPQKAGKPLDFIPFAIVGIDGKDSDLDEPPLIDLVDLNLSHYRTTADYEHGCHFTGLPTPWVAGLQQNDGEQKLYIGSTHAWVFGDPQAKAGFLEFTGQGLGALEKNLDRKEQQMALIGARMLFADKKAAETAQTTMIQRQGEVSILASIALAISESLTWALQVFSDWAGQNATVSYELARDFNPMGLDAPTLIALLKAVQAGEMSRESFFDLLQRADVVDPELTYEEEQARIAADAPPRPTPANDAGTGAAA